MRAKNDPFPDPPFFDPADIAPPGPYPGGFHAQAEFLFRLAEDLVPLRFIHEGRGDIKVGVLDQGERAYRPDHLRLTAGDGHDRQWSFPFQQSYDPLMVIGIIKHKILGRQLLFTELSVKDQYLPGQVLIGQFIDGRRGLETAFYIAGRGIRTGKSPDLLFAQDKIQTAEFPIHACESWFGNGKAGSGQPLGRIPGRHPVPFTAHRPFTYFDAQLSQVLHYSFFKHVHLQPPCPVIYPPLAHKKESPASGKPGTLSSGLMIVAERRGVVY